MVQTRTGEWTLVRNTPAPQTKKVTLSREPDVTSPKWYNHSWVLRRKQGKKKTTSWVRVEGAEKAEIKSGDRENFRLFTPQSDTRDLAWANRYNLPESRLVASGYGGSQPNLVRTHPRVCDANADCR